MIDKEVVKQWEEDVIIVNEANGMLKGVFSRTGVIPERDILEEVIIKLNKISKWGTSNDAYERK